MITVSKRSCYIEPVKPIANELILQCIDFIQISLGLFETSLFVWHFSRLGNYLFFWLKPSVCLEIGRVSHVQTNTRTNLL